MGTSLTPVDCAKALQGVCDVLPKGTAQYAEMYDLAYRVLPVLEEAQKGTVILTPNNLVANEVVYTSLANMVAGLTAVNLATWYTNLG